MSYNINNLKEIFQEIIKEEQKYTPSLKANIYTIVEYYKSEQFKKELKLTKPIASFKKIIETAGLKGGYNPKTKEIIVLINRLYEHLEIISPDSFAKMIIILYHEIRHRHQEEIMTKEMNYSNFLMSIEKSIIKTDHLYYQLNHNNFFIEIDANDIGTKKANKYIKENTNIYEESQKYLNNFQKSNEQNKEMYNPYAIFKKFNFTLQGKIKKHIKKNNPNPLEQSLNELFENDNIKKTFKEIYNIDGSYKGIEELLNKRNTIDIRIINLIISSKSYLKTLNINTLNTLEKEYLEYILEKKYKEEEQQIQLIEQIPKQEITIFKKYRKLKLKRDLNNITILLNNLTSQKKKI